MKQEVAAKAGGMSQVLGFRTLTPRPDTRIPHPLYPESSSQAKQKVAAKGWGNVHVVEADACTFTPPGKTATLVTFSYSLSSASQSPKTSFVLSASQMPKPISILSVPQSPKTTHAFSLSGAPLLLPLPEQRGLKA